MANAHLLASTSTITGLNSVVIPYWEDDGTRDHSNYPAYLIPGGFGAAPKLSAFKFDQKFGFSLDLIDFAAHSFAIDDLRADTILLESVWNQHLRGVANNADDIIQRFNPDVVFIPHGAEVVSRILARMAAYRRIPYLYWESPFFRGYNFVDPCAPHFFRGACRLDNILKEKQNSKPDPDALRRAEDFIRAWRDRRGSKYEQVSDPREVSALKGWIAKGDGPILFVPGQIPYDANVAVSLRSYPDLPTIYRTLFRELPPNWRVVFKPHPLGRPAIETTQSDRFQAVFNVNIHDLFEVCTAVATHSSNVGLEALMAGLPVFVWGDPIYAGRGLTVDLADVKMIREALNAAHLQPPARESVLSFLHLLVSECLVKQDQPEKMAELIAEAKCDVPEARLAWYGAHTLSMASAAFALKQCLEEHGKISAAIAKLPATHRAVLQRKFGGELLNHAYGGARTDAKKLAFSGVHPNLGSLFSSAFRQEVIVEKVDLQNVYDPAAIFKSIASKVSASRSVAFMLRNADLEDWFIQSIEMDDLERLARDSSPRVHISLFGLNGNKLKSASADDPHIVVLLRDSGLAPISKAECDACLNSMLSFSSHIIPPAAFSYRDDIRLSENVAVGPFGMQGHAIYGPHLQLPEGSWRIEFLLKSKHVKHFRRFRVGRLPRVTLDVYSADAGILAEKQVDMGQLFESTLTFKAHRGQSYEFRVFDHCSKRPEEIVFAGVKLDYVSA